MQFIPINEHENAQNKNTQLSKIGLNQQPHRVGAIEYWELIK